VEMRLWLQTKTPPTIRPAALVSNNAEVTRVWPSIGEPSAQIRPGWKAMPCSMVRTLGGLILTLLLCVPAGGAGAEPAPPRGNPVCGPYPPLPSCREPSATQRPMATADGVLFWREAAQPCRADRPAVIFMRIYIADERASCAAGHRLIFDTIQDLDPTSAQPVASAAEVASDALVALAARPTGKRHLAQVHGVHLAVGTPAAVRFKGKYIEITVDPAGGDDGRPSSLAIQQVVDHPR